MPPDLRRPSDVSRGRRVVMSDSLAIETVAPTHVVLVEQSTGARLRVSPTVYEFLLGFREPRWIATGEDERLAARIRHLMERSLLVDPDLPHAPPPARLRTVAYRFCNTPPPERDERPDFIVFGLPYDLTEDIDARTAPAAIRMKSLDYPYLVDMESRQPKGWFDVERGRRILEGVTIRDAGDVAIDYAQSRDSLFTQAGTLIATRCQGGAIPVVLGGDASISDAVTRRPDGDGPRCVRLGEDVLPGAVIHLSIDLRPLLDDKPFLDMHDAKVHIAVLGATCRIAGIDLVGLDAYHPLAAVAPVMACHLLLAAMQAAHAGRTA